MIERSRVKFNLVKKCKIAFCTKTSIITTLYFRTQKRVGRNIVFLEKAVILYRHNICRSQRVYIGSLRNLVTFLSNVHFSFNPDEAELLSWSVAIIKVQLLPRLNSPFRKDSNPVVPIHHHNFSIAVGIDRVICKADFVAFTGCVHNEIIIQVEKETAHVLVVHFPPSVSLILCNYFPTIL